VEESFSFPTLTWVHNLLLKIHPKTWKRDFFSKRPTERQQQNLECSAMWNLSDSEIKSIPSPSFNASLAPRHIQVLITVNILNLRFNAICYCIIPVLYEMQERFLGFGIIALISIEFVLCFLFGTCCSKFSMIFPQTNMEKHYWIPWKKWAVMTS